MFDYFMCKFAIYKYFSIMDNGNNNIISMNYYILLKNSSNNNVSIVICFCLYNLLYNTIYKIK